MRTQGWQMAVAIGLGMFGVIGLPSVTLAQTAPSNIVPDATLGAERSQVTINGIFDLIAGGAQRGQNLFHSFSQFNVSAGRGAYFAIQNDVVRNVLTRVTGGSRSDILGTLGTFRPSDGSVRVPGVNLFLINPNGIVFGENANLDIGGSFFATTANAVQLGDAGLFSASKPASSNLLTVDPSAFLFNAIANQNLPEIVVQSQATSTILGESTFGLRVPNRETLLLLGGTVNISGGQLNAWGGRIEIAGAASDGMVQLNKNGSLAFPENVKRADVTLTNKALADISLDDAGTIAITARNLNLSESFLRAGIFNGLGTPQSHAGDVILDATGSINIERSSFIDNSVGSGAFGSAGNLNIKAGSLLVTDGSGLIANTRGQGNAGSVRIRAEDNIVLDNQGYITSGIDFNGIGNGGDVLILTNSLQVLNGAQLGSVASGLGNAGSILISAHSRLVVDGASLSDISGIVGSRILISSGIISIARGRSGSGGNIIIQAGEIQVNNGGQLSASSNGSGDSGNITIQAGEIQVNNGGQLSASSTGNGDNGNILIKAKNAISLTGSLDGFASQIFTFSSNNGKGGNITTEAQSLHITDNAAFNALTFGREGGNIFVNVATLDLLSGGQLSTTTLGNGQTGKVTINAKEHLFISGLNAANDRSSGLFVFFTPSSVAGEIEINARTVHLDNQGQIVVNAPSGSGGNLTLNLQDLLLMRHGSLISASAGTEQNQGNGGNININIPRGFIVAIPEENSDIVANATVGRGGNVNVSAQGIFGLKLQPKQTPQSDITASSQFGVSGTVVISSPDTSFLQNSLTEFPQILTDTTQLLANSCIVRRGQQSGSFTITGSGGLPQRPSDAPVSPFPTGEVRTVAADAVTDEMDQLSPSPGSSAAKPLPRSWKIGDPIVEPQGVYQLANGDLVMSRECSK